MDVAKQIALSTRAWRDNLGRAFVVVSLALCVYQLWRRWRDRRAIHRKVRGKVVLITGASSGLGEALARVLYSMGAKVILASRNLQQLERLKFQLDSEPANKESASAVRFSPKVLQLDLEEPSSIAKKCLEAVSLFGSVDILINNAGISSRGAVVDSAMDVDRRVMQVNFFGTVAITKGLLPHMLEHGGGHIVVVSSLQGKIGLPYRSSYSASKHALQGYFDSLRVELAPRGVRVCVVCPGYIKTQLSSNALRGDGRTHGVTDATTAAGMDPHYAAQKIVMAMATGERELVLAKMHHQLSVYLKVMCPSLLDWLVRRRSKVN